MPVAPLCEWKNLRAERLNSREACHNSTFNYFYLFTVHTPTLSRPTTPPIQYNTIQYNTMQCNAMQSIYIYINLRRLCDGMRLFGCVFMCIRSSLHSVRIGLPLRCAHKRFVDIMKVYIEIEQCHADDTALFSTTPEGLNNLVQAVNKHRAAYKLSINVAKTKIMELDKWQDNANIVIDNINVEQVQSFQYLGAMFTTNGYGAYNIKQRLAMAVQALNNLQYLWKSATKELKHSPVNMYIPNCYIWVLNMGTAQIRYQKNKCC